MRYLVIGAGPAGLAAAYRLSKKTSEVTVLEADNCVGGLARSLQLWDQIVDLGPHRFFSKDRRVNQLWLEAVGSDYVMVKRQTRILYGENLFQYPLEPLDSLLKLGFVESINCVSSYIKECISPTKQNGTFESWVCRRFGRRLFEIFFKTYSEKLWGIPCHELDSDFAAQRIKKFSLSAAIAGAVFHAKRKKHRTLADEFAYPTGGTGHVYERMANMVKQNGGSVMLNTPVKKVLTRHNTVTGVELVSGATLECEHVISTMPLTKLATQLDDAPPEILEACKQLKFRNTILVYLEILKENPFTDNWIYMHSPTITCGRVTNFRNWAPQLCQNTSNTILAMEYWCDFDTDLWCLEDEKLGNLARKEIVDSGLVDSANKLGRSFVFRIPRSYPVYRHGYREPLGLLKSYLKGIKELQVVGRYGAFKYNNQDHSILMGYLAAENIISGANHDLWTVNSDYEVYQEECSISETGLVQLRK